MKKKLLLLLLLFLKIALSAQTQENYSFDAQFIYGNILKHTKHLENAVKGPVLGGEFDVEWQTMGEKPWHEYFRFPAIGLGFVGLDLGNPDMLGQLLAVYPYLNFRLFDDGFLKINLKGGAGVSFLNKRFDNTATDPNNLNTGNAAIGSIVNVYLAGGGNVEFPFSESVSAVLAFGWNHASNGSFYQPNSGINMINASVGLKYNPVYKKDLHPVYRNVENMPQKFTVELIASGGARELYYKDNKMYPTGSLVLAVYRQLGNKMRLGVGIDGFYDGVYDGTSQYERTFLTTNEFKNKLRAGISLQPELVFGRFTAGIHWGVYVYNPLKNLEPYEGAKKGKLNKPLIYSYDIEQEDGWLYTRAALKYALTKHLIASVGLKTHQQKAEFVEWGLGVRF
jgi:hypothetical protein